MRLVPIVHTYEPYLTDETQTFFGAGFFNFDHKISSSVVSPWIWLYFVMTAALTGILYVTWGVICRKILDHQSGCPNAPGPPVVEKSILKPSIGGTPSDALQSATGERLTAVGNEHGGRNVSIDANKEDVHHVSPSYEPTWFPAKLGWPLEEDQCSVCFEIPSEKSE